MPTAVLGRNIDFTVVKKAVLISLVGCKQDSHLAELAT